ncbi:unnamed protein product [Phytophthora fragariaefolia]|uniref:Unnamed protein product n=1 Tax=Phytophthora fragariaefolia TaxID=1490495 RepID=A0A9W6XZM6_9STRA|nr:unnamed protein product [Phytophthora fragariaefolia]
MSGPARVPRPVRPPPLGKSAAYIGALKNRGEYEDDEGDEAGEEEGRRRNKKGRRVDRKGLLKAGLIAFSDSPWASPIVIVLKKNGVDIRLCIDYKIVNSVTAIMEYAMPLVDDLLTDMEKYLWYCSLDVASGFWAVMMTKRARKVSAFVCALGHFEWLRMPFGLKNAPMIYQRMIDNALWGFVQPRGGWSTFAERVRKAEAADTAVGGSTNDTATRNRTRFEADRESSNIPDSLSAVVNDPRGGMFASGEADQSSLVATAPILRHFDRAKEIHVMLFANDWALSTTLMRGHDGVMHPVRFCGRVLKDNEVNYHPAEKEVLALLLLLKTCYTQLTGRTINAYTRFSTLGWINTSNTLFGRSTQFAVMLSPWHLVVYRVKEDDSAFAQLLHSTIANSVGLDETLQRVAPPSKRAPMVRMDPALLYARLPNGHQGFVLSFDGSAKMPKHGGYGSCAWILWRLPDWKIEIATSAYLESTTVNQAEYMGMNEGLRAAQAHGVTDLVVVGDSRLAIQPSLGVIACLKESLLTQLNIHRELVARFPSARYLHGTREYNASADSLAGETLAAKETKTTLTEESKSKLEQLNRIHEVIYGKPSREGSEALPVEPEPPDRPNDATTAPSHVENGEISSGAAEPPPSAEDIGPLEVQEERCRRVGRAQDEELRWINLKLVLKGESSSLGYKAAREAWKMADRFVLSDDGLLYFLGENRRWGKDRMNETVFRLVVQTTMVQEVLQRCHDSPEGGHQGIVRTFHRVKADYYWIGLYADVERHVRSCPDCSSIFAINNSQDTTRKETPFYLVHGWDAESTLKAMASSLKRGFGRQSNALAWRREVNRQQEIALKVAKEYQVVEKARRANEHNDSLSRKAKASLPRPRVNENSEDNPEDAESTSTLVNESPKSLFEPGDRVWLYMERVKPGLTFYPVVHVSRLKAVKEFGDRPKVRLARELTDEARLDFDEELLPEDSWGPDTLAGEYEVESILDDRRPMETSSRRSVREFLVKWVGYVEPTWEPMTSLSC